VEGSLDHHTESPTIAAAVSEQEFTYADEPAIHKLSGQLLTASSQGNTSEVLRLLSEGALVNYHDKYGDTPLSYAVYSGHTVTAIALLDKGAVINSQDTKGDTPLILACVRGHYEAAEV